jgi:hypothetical protein
VDFKKTVQKIGITAENIESGTHLLPASTTITLVSTAKKICFIYCTVDTTLTINGTPFQLVCPFIETEKQPAIFFFTGTVSSLTINNAGTVDGFVSYFTAE